MLYFTSDTHFGHKAIINHCYRKFSSVEEMDEILIKNWNSKISVNDTIYHLGDFTLKRKDFAQEIFSQLNGNIKVLKYHWHHDHSWVKYGDYKNKQGKLIEIVEPMVYLRHEGERITMSHFPLAHWHASHHGAWHLHGHSHGAHKPAYGKILDVGVDVHKFFPVSFEEIKEIMETKSNGLNHHL